MAKKRVLVLADSRKWMRWSRRMFPATAPEVEFSFQNSRFINSDHAFRQLVGDHDLVWCSHCYKIIPANLAEEFRFINSHPGYSPWNRGWYPYVFAILTNTPAGATLHEIDKGIDTGPVIEQIRIHFDDEVTAKSLYRQCHEAEKALVLSNLRRVIYGDYSATPITERGTYHSRADYAALLSLDWIEQRCQEDPALVGRWLRATCWKGERKAFEQSPYMFYDRDPGRERRPPDPTQET